MKPTDFITENHNIVQAVVEMHDDHEIQMAREQCYNAASNAIELHRMLKQITEREGLEGWVQEKITLANDYLRQVKEWMEHDLLQRNAMPVAAMGEDASAGASSAGAVATSTAVPKSRIPAYQRKKFGGKDWKVTAKDIEKEPSQKNLISHPQVLRRNIGA
jgi:hypothetical protein